MFTLQVWHFLDNFSEFEFDNEKDAQDAFLVLQKSTDVEMMELMNPNRKTISHYNH